MFRCCSWLLGCCGFFGGSQTGRLQQYPPIPAGNEPEEAFERIPLLTRPGTSAPQPIPNYGAVELPERLTPYSIQYHANQILSSIRYKDVQHYPVEFCAVNEKEPGLIKSLDGNMERLRSGDGEPKKMSLLCHNGILSEKRDHLSENQFLVTFVFVNTKTQQTDADRYLLDIYIVKNNGEKYEGSHLSVYFDNGRDGVSKKNAYDKINNAFGDGHDYGREVFSLKIPNLETHVYLQCCQIVASYFRDNSTNIENLNVKAITAGIRKEISALKKNLKLYEVRTALQSAYVNQTPPAPKPTPERTSFFEVDLGVDAGDAFRRYSLCGVKAEENTKFMLQDDDDERFEIKEDEDSSSSSSSYGS